MPHDHADLFERPITLPTGFRYRPGLITPEVERGLIAELETLSFSPFEFHGFLGKRQVVSYGWRYDFGGGGLQRTEEIPQFLDPVREQAARVFGLEPESFEQVLLTQYPAGSTIGWHKDRPVFRDVIGISLKSACTFRFRKKSAAGWERSALTVEPGSAYVLQGLARTEWEHSIPAVAELRYSITFRSLR
jgi:alkylated DNA repair dioxygenase AlkB